MFLERSWSVPGGSLRYVPSARDIQETLISLIIRTSVDTKEIASGGIVVKY